MTPRLRALLPSLLVLAGLASAGCLGGSDDGPDGADAGGGLEDDHGPGFSYDAVDVAGLPVAQLLCHGDACNFEMTPDEGRQGNEVTIAVNPLDPRNVVGGAKDYYPPDAGECVWDGVYVTHDGGRTPYEDRSFDGSPWRLLQDPNSFQPNYATQFWCTTDPVAYFDVNGRFYYVLMAYQADRVTGSKIGEDLIPPHPLGEGALNDWAFNRATQIVAISDDGGDTFHTFTPVLEGSYPIAFHDKAWLAASQDGTIHIMWVSGVALGNIYCRSTDEGATFLCDEVLSLDPANPDSPGSGQGSFLEVGTGPEVYATWQPGGIAFRRSMDTGDTWEPGSIIQGINAATMPGLEARDRRGGFAALGSDRNPDSPLADSLYVVWDDACLEAEWSQGCSNDANASAVWVIASHDKGLTWGEPVQVTKPNGTGWSVFPAVSVSPGGVVDVSWMSSEGTRRIACKGEETPDCVEGYGEEYPALTQMHSYSLDGGKTFAAPLEIRDAGDGGWDPALCHHQNGMVFIGDYNDIDSSWQAAHPVWPDSRLGVCDVFTATVQRPMFAEGWDGAKRDAAEAWILDHPL